jgi:hypothetical protein
VTASARRERMAMTDTTVRLGKLRRFCRISTSLASYQGI